ncbi:TetR family transcriptional regulator [Rhodococcus sp. OK302]
MSSLRRLLAERHEAGVSVGSLYQYFPDKHAIIHAMALRAVADLLRA